MAFKRYAALLAGSAIIGSGLLVPSAMAQEGGNDTATVQCYKTETTVTVTVPTVQRNQNRTIQSVTVSGLTGVTATASGRNNRTVQFKVPEGTPAGTYEATLRYSGGGPGQGGNNSERVNFTVVHTSEDIQTPIDCATITIADTSVVEGNTKNVDVTIPEGASNLAFTAPDDLKVSHADGKLTVDATDAAVGEYTVGYSWNSVGTEDPLNASFKVTVLKSNVQTIEDVTVTEGEKKVIDVTEADGVSQLDVTAPEGLEVSYAEGELTVDATGAAVKDYTVTFSYQANGVTKNGSFKVTVEAKPVVVTQTIEDVTVTEGEKEEFPVTEAEGVSQLDVTAPEGLGVSYADGKLTVDATAAEAKEYTVTFTYQANGEEKDGTFKVTVEKKADVVTQIIEDVTVTEGEKEEFPVTEAEGVSQLDVTAPEGLGVSYEEGKLTVDATEAEAGEYTVAFTYQANGEEKDGTFKVTVEKKADEPKDSSSDASSKASSEFKGSFKGLSSK